MSIEIQMLITFWALFLLVTPEIVILWLKIINLFIMQDFVHLHVHTQYSLLDGQASVSALVDKAMKNGMKGIAVTDHGNMFGINPYFFAQPVFDGSYDVMNTVSTVLEDSILDRYELYDHSPHCRV